MIATTRAISSHGTDALHKEPINTMERVRHARIPVHLNAVLIGEKTVPKGCKVRNVSNQGLLLQCDADGRMLTFKGGDHVDIHLLFHRPNGTKYHTVAANVRHVDANGIGVEFCQPDGELVKLIESYRVDDTQSLEASITHRSNVGGRERMASVVTIPSAASSARVGRQHPVDNANNKHLAYIGMLSLAVAAIIFAGSYLRTFDLDSRVSQLESLANLRNGALARFNAHPLAPANTGGVVPDGNKPSKPAVAGTGSVVVPVREIATAAATIQTADVPQPESRPAGLSDTKTLTAATGVAPAGLTDPDTPVNKKDHDVMKHGPWVINLMSSPNKSDADRFAENAGKQGFQVEQVSVNLNGREFYRVQMTGFATSKEARASAEPVQERLGLKDVWIFKP
jgi:hypothetical protein